ncbi:hypothetical protein XENOCAPTIV_024736, partial [Xenoophorus captivus]
FSETPNRTNSHDHKNIRNYENTSLFYIVCVPHDWRVTLVVIIAANAVASFMLEVRSPDITPSILSLTDPPEFEIFFLLMCSQAANDSWGALFLSRLFCRRNKAPKVLYRQLALELQECADWPPKPSIVTYASDPQSHISATL